MPTMRDYKRRGQWCAEDPLPPERSLDQTLRLRRWIGRFAAGAMVISIAAILAFFLRGGFVNRDEDPIPSEEQFQARVGALADAQATLEQLDSVLADQRKTLEDRQFALGQLQREHEALSKVLAMDRATVEQIFEQQRRRNEREVWKERGVAFVLGVLSGMLTALLLHWAKIIAG